MMTTHTCSRCGRMITADPNPLVDFIRNWSWRLAHRLTNCGGAA